MCKHCGRKHLQTVNEDMMNRTCLVIHDIMIKDEDNKTKPCESCKIIADREDIEAD